jgi:hypothetical protein
MCGVKGGWVATMWSCLHDGVSLLCFHGASTAWCLVCLAHGSTGMFWVAFTLVMFMNISLPLYISYEYERRDPGYESFV